MCDSTLMRFDKYYGGVHEILFESKMYSWNSGIFGYHPAQHQCSERWLYTQWSCSTWSELVEGTSSADVIDCSTSSIRHDIYGYQGSDIIIGSDYDDFIAGGSGNDMIHGGDGNDRIDGGAGDDMIFGEG